MAPSQKRKPIDDDFVHTISDNDEDIVEEEEAVAPPPKKKVKTAKKSKKSKKGEEEEEEEREGIWGKNEDDDGAMDSDFEFAQDGAVEFGDDEFEGWGFDGAKKSMKNQDPVGVDLDEIIRRRRAKKTGNEEPEAAVEEEAGDDEEVENDMDIDLDDDEDGVLADDAFGMGVDPENEGSADEEIPDAEDAEDDDAAASDNDSVATPVDHPDDARDDSDDEEEDAEEQAKRDAFFAPEEPAQPGKKDIASSFQGMSLSRPLLRGLAAVGFSKPTPIQAKTVPIALMGKDVVGGAVTGSGKTAAFVVPILERLLYRPKKVPTSRVVILTPTRELAIQCHAVATKLAAYTDIKFTLAVGGLSLKQQEVELRLRPDVIIATPGRFIDHMRNSASFNVDTVEILVLDEADRMLEDGFADELNEILTTLPKSRQTMLFSATMTSSVDRLVRVGMNKPARVMVDSQKKTVGTLVQEFIRLRPGREEKRMGYLIHICKTMHTERVIIFFRQKKEAHRARIIFGMLGMSCAELHGSMNQAQRIASVENFRDGKVNYLLATDLASRGLDIKGVDTVINYEAPQKLEIYVHRVGRTARAGRSGTAVTLAAEPDRKVVKAAVKAGKSQGAKIMSRVIEPAEADKWQAQVDEMEDEIEEIIVEEKQEKQFAQAEMQVRKGENILEHEAEIKSRPKRTWFETEQDKKKAKDAGRAELNGEGGPGKKKVKMSNKARKQLDAKATRSEGHVWKKGKAERAGQGAVLNLKKKKVPKNGRMRAKMARGKSLLRYLFPRTVRDRYRERVLNFRLDTLPQLKHRFQSRIYRLILERQRKRNEQSRLVDVFRRQSRRLLLGPPPARPARHARAGRPGKKMPTWSDYTGNGGGGAAANSSRNGDGNGYGYGAAPEGEPAQGERGFRRKWLAAKAGSMYRAGAVAMNEIREGYAQTRVRSLEADDGMPRTTIPGSFPDVAITVQGDDQMVIFPSYAKRHTKQDWGDDNEYISNEPHGAIRDSEYWRQEWERNEDERAIVDIDVRGWVYSPHKGPMTRRNRILIGLARQLSGIPAPRQDAPPSDSLGALHQSHEERREQEKIAKEAAEIEKRGQEERRVANRGGFSEAAREEDDDDAGSIYPARSRSRSGTRTPMTAPGSPKMPARQYTNGNELSEAELSVANANLMARIAPFMTTPLIQLPITIFFYNDEKSASRTVQTNDAGHFVIRAALDFVPTHVRVLANQSLSAVQEVKIIEPRGVSLISDIDDTIKRSNISGGAKEIFRNTFIRELKDLTVEGVKEWYNELHAMGVSIHYCSNSPWQLFPVLASYFMIAGLPPGSLHLKQYSGMLQGIFEPVAERKKSTLTRLMKDFPERKFLLVGDSGEADLEVYTELVETHPGRIIAVFIRDVTTPEQSGYFDSSFEGTARQKAPTIRLQDKSDEPVNRPGLPPRGEVKTVGPVMGDLIDFSDEPEQANLDDAAALAQLKARPKPTSTDGWEHQQLTQNSKDTSVDYPRGDE
ncbi:ATP-dependent RNA helicase DRS1 [Colletotrichum sp. SAR11_239]|nr:ATP-dependent RNA helicase DRS1 [Colletotrichum sp. SAR11_239]